MHLMVIVEDRISEWVSKGELLDGYFTPSAAFETVTVFGLVGDRPADTVLARLCAPAQHRYIGAGIDRRRLMIATGGLQPGLLMRALRRLMLLIPPDQPAVVRACIWCWARGGSRRGHWPGHGHPVRGERPHHGRSGYRGTLSGPA